jgi:hypothetical protein
LKKMRNPCPFRPRPGIEYTENMVVAYTLIYWTLVGFAVCFLLKITEASLRRRVIKASLLLFMSFLMFVMVQILIGIIGLSSLQE